MTGMTVMTRNTGVTVITGVGHKDDQVDWDEGGGGENA